MNSSKFLSFGITNGIVISRLIKRFVRFCCIYCFRRRISCLPVISSIVPPGIFVKLATDNSAALSDGKGSHHRRSQNIIFAEFLVHKFRSVLANAQAKYRIRKGFVECPAHYVNNNQAVVRSGCFILMPVKQVQALRC